MEAPLPAAIDSSPPNRARELVDIEGECMYETSSQVPDREWQTAGGTISQGTESPIRFHRLPRRVAPVLGRLLLRSFHGGSKHTSHEL